MYSTSLHLAMMGTIRVFASLTNCYSRLLVSLLDETKAIVTLHQKAHLMLVLSYGLSCSSLKMKWGNSEAPPGLAFHLALYPTTSLEMTKHRLIGIHSIMTILEPNTLSFLYGHGYSQNTVWAGLSQF